jgi:hypothetical protein
MIRRSTIVQALCLSIALPGAALADFELTEGVRVNGFFSEPDGD